jgi:hypothetical protein
MQIRRAINILLRFVIIAVAGVGLLEFSDLIWMELYRLTHPFNLFTLAAGIFGPASAIAAIALATVNKSLPLAAIFAVSSVVIFVMPLVVFIFRFAK